MNKNRYSVKGYFRFLEILAEMGHYRERTCTRRVRISTNPAGTVRKADTAPSGGRRSLTPVESPCCPRFHHSILYRRGVSDKGAAYRISFSDFELDFVCGYTKPDYSIKPPLDISLAIFLKFIVSKFIRCTLA